MSKYNVLWVDDDWSDNADKTNYNYLSKTRKHIDVNLKRTNIEFAWALRKNPEEGVVELRQGMDFRMAIIDLMFSSTRFNINPIISTWITERGLEKAHYDKIKECAFYIFDDIKIAQEFKKTFGI